MARVVLMAVLKRVALDARISWLGIVPDRAASLRATPLASVQARFDGFEGECHGGAIRPSCARVTALHPRGTPIRNTRQVTVLSTEELAETAAALGIAALAPEWVGASMIVTGLPDLTHLPPGSRLQAPSGATLAIDMENLPCAWTGREIEAEHPGLGRAYPAAAKGRRGLTAWVEREGALHLNDALTLFIPAQRKWRG
jgi:hypothetical protein